MSRNRKNGGWGEVHIGGGERLVNCGICGLQKMLLPPFLPPEFFSKTSLKTPKIRVSQAAPYAFANPAIQSPEASKTWTNDLGAAYGRVHG